MKQIWKSVLRDQLHIILLFLVCCGPFSYRLLCLDGAASWWRERSDEFTYVALVSFFYCLLLFFVHLHSLQSCYAWGPKRAEIQKKYSVCSKNPFLAF